MIQADELWSFVGSKVQVQWVWVALDGASRRVLGMAVGDRTTAAARRLWATIPRPTQATATVYTGHLASYRDAIPAAQHRAVGKDTGLTAHVERFWLTLRQRCSRLVRKSLSFSKCPRSHAGAIWYFIRHYNQCRQ